MARKSFAAGRDEDNLARRFRALRTEAVLLAPGTSLLLGLTVLAAIGAYVGTRLGLLLPTSIIAVAVIGGAATLAKILLDRADHSTDPALWRQLLTERFETGGAADPEIRRLTALAIDLRTRIADAEVHADEQGRALVAETIPALDGWIDGIARLSHRLAELRFEGKFQVDLADTSRRRLLQIELRQQKTTDPDLLRQMTATAEGMRQQIRAAERFRNLTDSGYLRLEHAVAALGTVGSQVVLVLARGSDLAGPQAIGLQIGQEVAALEGLIQALDRVSATQDALLPESLGGPDAPPTAATDADSPLPEGWWK